MPVRDVRLSGVAVHIAVTAGGESNLPRLPASEAVEPAKPSASDAARGRFLLSI